MPGSIRIHSNLEIPASDLEWSWARSSGPGGQHVNTSETKAVLRFALSTCAVLREPVKERLRDAHGQWVNSDGDMVLASDTHRSRHMNIQAVEDRLANAIREALTPPKRRKKTRPSRSARRKRLNNKKQRGELKKLRKSPKRYD